MKQLQNTLENSKARNLSRLDAQSEITRLSSRQIDVYGVDLFLMMRGNFSDIEPNFRSKHQMTVKMRKKMIDWMVEVFCTYDCSYTTMFTAVQIYDSFLNLFKVQLSDKDVHLIGCTAMFMASKYQDIRMIDLRRLTENIAHGNFSEIDIERCETVILDTIGFERLAFACPIDYINTFIFDFISNNGEAWSRIGTMYQIRCFSEISYFYALVALHFEEFSVVDVYLMSVVCLIAGLDNLRSKVKISELGVSVLIQFVENLYNNSGLDLDKIKTVKEQLNEAFEKYKTSIDIEKNLLNDDYQFNGIELVALK